MVCLAGSALVTSMLYPWPHCYPNYIPSLLELMARGKAAATLADIRDDHKNLNSHCLDWPYILYKYLNINYSPMILKYMKIDIIYLTNKYIY